jgi:hypothetical protein
MVLFNNDRDNFINLLTYLGQMEAIQFYRNQIGETYSELFKEIHGNYFSENFYKYIDLDIFISPFTSYPINNPVQILFGRPFERLYDNLYFIDEADYKKAIQRAFIVYDNFEEILYNAMKYLLIEKKDCLDYKIREFDWKNDYCDEEYREEESCKIAACLDEKMKSLCNKELPLNNILKASIFYWNITSYRIDSLFQKLRFYKELIHTSYENCRIFNDEKVLKIINLETDEFIIDPNELRDIDRAYFLIDVMIDNTCEDIFTSLRPCNIFHEKGFDVKIRSYDELLENLRNFYKEE